MPEAADSFAPAPLGSVRLTDGQFRRIAGFFEGVTGVRMPDHKRELVQARLAKRLRVLGLPDYEAYVAHAFGPSGWVERVHLVDALTTNKTDFFREADHFDYLKTEVLPTLHREDPEVGHARPLLVWSAGCATGEEPYTLAMTLAESGPVFGAPEYVVFATDISGRALQRARLAVYDEARVAPVPPELRRRYLLQSRDRSAREVRVSRDLRSRVRFAQMNLLTDLPPFRQPADIVFCRNVLIYFELETQRRVLTRIAQNMRAGGYLYLGHSETLHGLGLPFSPAAPTVYRRD
jgi:chemotaxis protein methyltransferase CheR